MKKKFLKGLAVTACAGLLITGAGAVAYAAQTEDTARAADAASMADTAPAAGKDSGAQLLSSVEKDEMVYVLTDATGDVQKVIVSDWIQNTPGSAQIADASGLQNVETVRGTQTPATGTDGSLLWDTNGEDLYYQGKIEKELPVSLQISYWLDGKSISPAGLAGKSGKVTIRFDYINKQYEMVEIDGKEEKIYVPFAMMTGMLLDNDVFTNVQVSNGKIVNDGSRITVIGIAFPGLQNNLQVDTEKFEIPGYFEVTADVKNFELGNTITVATKAPFDQIDTEQLDSVDELRDSLHALTDAMDQLLDGSSQLYDGLSTLLEKSGELTMGVGRLADGAGQLQSGTGALHAGASSLSDGTAQLQGGANTLADGLHTLDGNSAALNAGARQVFDTLLATANAQLAAQLPPQISVPTLTIENYDQVLTGLIQTLNPGTAYAAAQSSAENSVTQAVNAQRDAIQAAVTDTVAQQITAQVTQQVTAGARSEAQAQALAAQGLTQEAYDAGIADGSVTPEQQAEVAAAIDAQMQSPDLQATIANEVAAQLQSPDVQAMIAAQTDGQIAESIAQNMGSDAVQGQINAAAAAARSGADSIRALKAQLDSYNAFYTGLTQYTAGVAQAATGADALCAGAGQVNAGAAQLQAGAAQLQSGAGELCDGVNTLKNSLPALTDGVTQLRDGAMQLSGGLQEFNEKGIQKLVDAAEGGLEGLTERIRATAEVSRGWRSFSGISEEMDGQVNFLYRTDAVEPKQ